MVLYIYIYISCILLPLRFRLFLLCPFRCQLFCLSAHSVTFIFSWFFFKSICFFLHQSSLFCSLLPVHLFINLIYLPVSLSFFSRCQSLCSVFQSVIFVYFFLLLFLPPVTAYSLIPSVSSVHHFLFSSNFQVRYSRCVEYSLKYNIKYTG